MSDAERIRPMGREAPQDIGFTHIAWGCAVSQYWPISAECWCDRVTAPLPCGIVAADLF